MKFQQILFSLGLVDLLDQWIRENAKGTSIFVSEARRNRSDGNFDGTNNAIGEYYLEEVHRRNCYQKREFM